MGATSNGKEVHVPRYDGLSIRAKISVRIGGTSTFTLSLVNLNMPKISRVKRQFERNCGTEKVFRHFCVVYSLTSVN